MAATCEELGIDLDLVRRRALLVKAEILTSEGEYHPKWFSEETLRKQRENNSVQLHEGDIQ